MKVLLVSVALAQFGGSDPADPQVVDERLTAVESRLEQREQQSLLDRAADAERAEAQLAEAKLIREAAERAEADRALEREGRLDEAERQRQARLAAANFRDGVMGLRSLVSARESDLAPQIDYAAASLDQAATNGADPRDVAAAEAALRRVEDAVNRKDGLALAYGLEALERTVGTLVPR